jgi:hypothetical protein
MTLIQIVNTIIVVSLSPMIATCYVLAQFVIQRFPEPQRKALKQYACQAAGYVEYQHPEAGADKKTLAIAYATDMFRLSGRPVPHDDMVEIAVGAALYEIQQNSNG